MSDAEIIELIRSGNHHRAAGKLYKYYPVIRKMVLHNSGSRQDAEDLYQEALLVLCRKISDNAFELSSSLNTYLYSVSRFMWLDELRKRNRRPSTTLVEETRKAEDRHIQQALEEEHNYSLAEKAFMQLGQKCRELLQLFYFKKLSMKEIAPHLGFGSERVAKTQKHRCIEKAKEHLKTLEEKI